MVERLDSLTPEQEALLPVWADLWTKIGLSCDPLNFPRAKQAVEMAYEAGGLKLPQHYFVADSPVSGAMMAVLLKKVANYNSEQDRASDPDPLVSTEGKFQGQSWFDIWEKICESAQNEVLDAITELTEARGNRGKLLTSLLSRISPSDLSTAFGEQQGGSHAAGWMSYYSFFYHACHLDAVEPLRGLMQLSRNSGWWAAYEDVVILQHRHCNLHLDDDGRLHNEEDFAVEYRDGWGVYAINGVLLDEQIIRRPETQTIDQLKNEENEEVKRIRIDRYGWDRFLTAMDAERIDKRPNDIEGTREVLYRCDGMILLRTFDPSTGKIFALEILDQDCKTCAQAQEWLWNMRPGDADRRIVGRT